MILPKEIKSFSNLQIYNAIKESEKELIKLKFKKVNGQTFKSHKIKLQKCYMVQLKTILTSRLYKLEKKQINNLRKLLEN